VSIPKNRRYGQWAGNPDGFAERLEDCREQVWGRDGRWTSYQCQRRRGHGPNGDLCKQHAKKYDEKRIAYCVMKNGWHDHFCEKCGSGFVCPKVTHCNDEWKTLCPDHKDETRQQ